MPDIDLPPSKFRRVTPLNKPLAVVFVIGGLIGLALIWWYRAGTSTEILLTALVAFSVGILVAGLMRNIN